MANFISQESIDEVNNRVDIVSIVGEYVPLVQKGDTWWGCCPFHNEKTPSFAVNPSKRLFHCFGCGAGGGAFEFVKQMEKVSFPEAVEILAKKAGVELHYSSKNDNNFERDENAKLKQEYTSLYTRVATSYHYFLTETEAGKFAYDYILNRGLTKETIEKFKLGYSPQDKFWLKKFLLSKNFSENFLNNSGLFSKKYPDISFFCDRLMFPIFNREGNVIAMGGRFLRGDESKSPKYLNSGDLIQYKKSNTLYAFNFAKQAIRQEKKVIFCEGYMDCIAYHQCGIEYAVAPLGTALTEEQIKIIKPFVDTVLLSFDSDGAGQKATLRAINMCRKEGLVVKIIKLQGGKDPAEIMVKYGPEYLTNEISKAIMDNDFLISKLLELYPKETPDGKDKASREFFLYMDSLQSDVQKDACLDKLCQVYGIDKEAARKDFTNRANLNKRLNKTYVNQTNSREALPKVVLNAELRAVLTAVTEDKKFFSKMNSEITVEDLVDPYAKKLFSVMKECLEANVFSVSNILNRINDENFVRLIIKFSEEFTSNIDIAVNDSIRLLKLNKLERKRNEIQSLISKLSSSPLKEDKDMLLEILSQKIELDSRIERIRTGNEEVN